MSTGMANTKRGSFSSTPSPTSARIASGIRRIAQKDARSALRRRIASIGTTNAMTSRPTARVPRYESPIHTATG
jgi:hypothetical protein